ncbi:MAG: FecR domain-containing protein [Pseudomonadota bacterium]
MEPGPENLIELLEVAHDWRARLDSPDATPADRAQCQRWLEADPRHALAYHQAESFWADLGTLDPTALDADLLLPTRRERLADLIDGLRAGLWSPARIGLAVTGMAALVVLTVWMNDLRLPHAGEVPRAVDAIRYTSPSGLTREFALDDGSLVTLAPGSELRWLTTNRTRTATLTAGAVLFDVAVDGNRPFTVHAGELRAVALGTTFAVNRSPDRTRVAVAEGNVEVSYPTLVAGRRTGGASRVALSLGQQVTATAAAGLQPVEPISAAAVGAWKDGRLVYSRTPLPALVADMNRYSDTPIVIDLDGGVAEQFLVRGAFDAGDVDGMLQTLLEIYPIVVDRSDPAVIVLRSRP